LVAGVALFLVEVQAGGDGLGGVAFLVLHDQPFAVFRGGYGKAAFALGDFKFDGILTGSAGTVFSFD
jgi:hypothetical protein